MMDEALSGYRHGGNDDDFNERVWKWAEIPDFNFTLVKDGKVYNCYSDEIKEEWNLAYDNYKAKIEKWKKGFHRSKLGNCLDADLFLVDLISSSYIDGPRAFFEPKTGDIGLLHNIGKWPRSIEYVADQVEIFAEENKEQDIVVTFFDEFYRDDICSVEPLATIRLHNGEITPIKTRTWKEVKYLEKVNYFKGSKNYHTKLYYKIRNFGFKLCKNFGKFIEKNFHNSSIYNAWVNEHNYRIMKNPSEQYFTEKEIYNIIDNWWRKQNNSLEYSS